MAQTLATGEKLSSLSVSQLVAKAIDKQRRKRGLTTDNVLRVLLKLPLHERKRGRPVKVKPKKVVRQSAKKKVGTDGPAPD